MATAQSIATGPAAVGAASPAGAKAQPALEPAQAAGGTAAAKTQALVPMVPLQGENQQNEFPEPVLRLPVELDVAVPVGEFRVRDLLALSPEHLIESRWGHDSDVPLAAGAVQLAWAEFEVVDLRLAVRVTRLA